MKYKTFCNKNLLICFFYIILPMIAVLALPPDVVVLLERVEISIKQNNYIAARQFLNEAKARVGNVHEIQKLEEELDKLIKEEVTKRLSLANFYKQSNPPKALELYKEVLQFDPNNEIANLEIQNIKEFLRIRDKYIEEGVYVPETRKNAYNPTTLSAYDYYNRALLAYKKDMLEVALDYAIKALELDSSVQEAKELLKQIQEQKRIKDMLFEAYNYELVADYTKIYEIYSELLKKEPKNLYYLLMKSLAANMIKKYDEALAGLIKVLVKYDELQSLLNNLYKNVTSKELIYLKHKISKTLILENIAIAYAGLGMFQYAAAVCAKSRSYSCNFFRLYFRSYRTYFIIIFIILLITMVLFIKLLLELDKLFSFVPFKVITLFLVTNIIILLKGNYRKYLQQIYTTLNVYKFPFFAYLAGLIFVLENDYNKSLFCFQQALSSKSLESKTYFYLGLLRIHLNSNVALNNLENSIVSALKYGYPCMPKHLQRIERDVKDKLVRLVENKLKVGDKLLLDTSLSLFYSCK